MKHRHWFVALALILVISIIQQSFRIELTQQHDPTTNHNYTESFINRLETISGTLLSGPRNTNWDQRKKHLDNNTYLYGWIYDITFPKAIDWLKLFGQTRPINLIVENSKYKQYSNDFAKLQEKLSENNILLYPDKQLGVTYTHAKTFVGDNTRAIQTANLNRSSFMDNKEHFFLSTDEKIKKDLLTLFLLDKEKIQSSDRLSASHYQQFIQESSPNLLVCPLNCRDKILTILAYAKKRIRISAQYISDPAILELLLTQSHLDIRIITNKLDSNRELIRTIGSDRITFESRLYNHDKLIISDDLLMIGSMNLSSNALDNNREIGIILTEPNHIQQAQELFTNWRKRKHSK